MTVVLAAIDDSAAALPVLRAAAAMAHTIGAEARAVYVREGNHETATAAAQHAGVAIDILNGDPVDCIVEMTAAPAVTMVVVGARRHRGGRQPSAVMSCLR